MQISASIGLLECSHIKFAYYVWLLLCCKSSLWWRPCGSSHHWELQLGVPQSAAMWFPLSELLSITCAVVLGISGIFITHAYLSCRNKKSGLWMSYLSSQWSMSYFVTKLWQSIVSVLQWPLSCTQRIQCMLSLLDWAFIAIFPTHRKAKASKVKILQMGYLKTWFFDQKRKRRKNENEAVTKVAK